MSMQSSGNIVVKYPAYSSIKSVIKLLIFQLLKMPVSISNKPNQITIFEVFLGIRIRFNEIREIRY